MSATLPLNVEVLCFRCRRPVAFLRDVFAPSGWRPLCPCFEKKP